MTAHVLLQCPYDGEAFRVEVTFLGDPPILNVEARDLAAHMREQHGTR